MALCIGSKKILWRFVIFIFRTLFIEYIIIRYYSYFYIQNIHQSTIRPHVYISNYRVHELLIRLPGGGGPVCGLTPGGGGGGTERLVCCMGGAGASAKS